jgi:Uma2 family endonuclease
MWANGIIAIANSCITSARVPGDQIFRTPPFICIEVLSPDDRVAGAQFGVPYVWVINPENRRVWIYTVDSSREIKDGILRTENPSLTVSLVEFFAGIDG